LFLSFILLFFLFQRVNSLGVFFHSFVIFLRFLLSSVSLKKLYLKKISLQHSLYY